MQSAGGWSYWVIIDIVAVVVLGLLLAPFVVLSFPRVRGTV
jgi:hypothetical protein